jgi:hypothetical protein
MTVWVPWLRYSRWCRLMVSRGRALEPIQGAAIGPPKRPALAVSKATCRGFQCSP